MWGRRIETILRSFKNSSLKVTPETVVYRVFQGLWVPRVTVVTQVQAVGKEFKVLVVTLVIPDPLVSFNFGLLIHGP